LGSEIQTKTFQAKQAPRALVRETRVKKDNSTSQSGCYEFNQEHLLEQSLKLDTLNTSKFEHLKSIKIHMFSKPLGGVAN